MHDQGRFRSYERKFAQFIRMCKETPPGETIAVTFPEVLGESYGELVESLNRIAEAELNLVILSRCTPDCCGYAPMRELAAKN